MHITAISEKYLISGETQDTAFMFVPSESIFAEIHENFEAIVQKAHRARVVIVSPSLLMLSIQVIQAILKDARMREQAHLIQGEVVRLMEDVSRLDDRVRKLQTHFGQASKDIDDILVSSHKVTKRGQKIEALEFGAAPPEADGRDRPRRASRAAQRTTVPRVVDSKTGQLRLGWSTKANERRSTRRPDRARSFRFSTTMASNSGSHGSAERCQIWFSRDRLFALARRADPDAVDFRPVADRGRIEVRAAFAAKGLRALGAALCGLDVDLRRARDDPEVLFRRRHGHPKSRAGQLSGNRCSDRYWSFPDRPQPRR